jgi:hypothetical protein
MNQALQVMALALPLPDSHLEGARTRSVVIDFAARQPVIIRENTSMQNPT